LGIFSTVLVYCVKKNLATLVACVSDFREILYFLFHVVIDTNAPFCTLKPMTGEIKKLHLRFAKAFSADKNDP
jgi:hypothetical protein